MPGITTLLADLERDFSNASSRAPRRRGHAVVEPLEHLNDRLGLAGGTVGHLMGVRNGDELRKAHEEAARSGHVLAARRAEPAGLPRAEGAAGRRRMGAARRDQQRIVTSLVRDAELSGVGLAGSSRALPTRSRPSSPSAPRSSRIMCSTRPLIRDDAHRARRGRGPARRARSSSRRRRRARPARRARPRPTARGASRSTRRATCRSSSTAGAVTCASASIART